MKLTVGMLICFFISISANSYSQTNRLNISLQNITIKSLFGYIEQNSEYVFLYRSEDFNTAKMVNIEIQEATINQVLDMVLKLLI